MAKLWIDRRFLLSLSAVVFIVSGALMTGQLRELLAGKGDLASVILDQDETIALMFVALGCLMEGRAPISEWLGRKSPEDEALNDTCEYYGFMILMVGLLVELLDQVLGILKLSGTALLGFEFAVNYPLNLYALGLLAAASYRILSPKPREA